MLSHSLFKAVKDVWDFAAGPFIKITFMAWIEVMYVQASKQARNVH